MQIMQPKLKLCIRIILQCSKLVITKRFLWILLNSSSFFVAVAHSQLRYWTS